ncbi:hypothetical protein D9M68_700940 [compost metagenome]
MQHGAGEVEDPPHLAGVPGRQAFPGTAGEYGVGEFDASELALAHRFAQFVEQVAQGLEQGLAAVTLLQGSAGGAAQEAVHGRKTGSRHWQSLALWQWGPS